MRTLPPASRCATREPPHPRVGWYVVALLLPSRPGEFHPEPLTDPDLILSHHPARAIARRLPASTERRALPGEPVGPNSAAMAQPLRSSPITGLRCYYAVVRPSPAHQYVRPRGWSRLRLFPSHRRQGSHVPYQSLVEVRAAYSRKQCDREPPGPQRSQCAVAAAAAHAGISCSPNGAEDAVAEQRRH